jgi:hypothetical protein
MLRSTGGAVRDGAAGAGFLAGLGGRMDAGNLLDTLIIF